MEFYEGWYFCKDFSQLEFLFGPDIQGNPDSYPVWAKNIGDHVEFLDSHTLGMLSATMGKNTSLFYQKLN